MATLQLKRRHHYVPQFWLKGFRDRSGNLYCLDGETVKVVAARDTMQENWLYTVFDERWTPSDELENALAKIEGVFAPIFEAIIDPTHSVSAEERDLLCLFLGIQACRHPDVMNRGRRKANDLADLLAGVHRFPGPTEFFAEVSRFITIAPSTGVELYQFLRAKTLEDLREQFDEVRTASPQDPRLPMQEALLAHTLVAQIVSRMQLTLLQTPPDSSFVLGDSSMPQFELSRGFRIPLSNSVALEARAVETGGFGTGRRLATSDEVHEVNHEQWANAKRLVIGSDRAVLRNLRGKVILPQD